MPWRTGSRYQLLADFLTAQSADEVTLNFAQIEAILRRPLPTSAHLREWWMGTPAASVPVRTWRQAGWEVASLTRRDREWLVTFRRRPVDTAP